MTRVGAFLLVALSGLGFSCGCTALGVSAAGLGGAVVGAGAGAAVKAGTEYQLGGAVARTRHHTVRMTFEPITDVLTRVRVTVGRSVLVKDVATADEIIRQLETTAVEAAASASPPRRARR